MGWVKFLVRGSRSTTPRPCVKREKVEIDIGFGPKLTIQIPREKNTAKMFKKESVFSPSPGQALPTMCRLSS